MERREAMEWLARTERVRRRTRAAAARYWFPLVVFGAIVLGAIPLYRESTGGGYGLPISYVGGFTLRSPRLVSLYWLVTLTAGYVATVAYERRRARRSGVAMRIKPFVVTGIALFALLIFVSPGGVSLLGLPPSWSIWSHFGDLFVRGLTPVLTIAVALVVLATFERSVVFAAYCLAFLGVALTVNLYNVENLTYRLGLGQHGSQINVLVAGMALLLGGVGFGIAAWRGQQR